MEIPPVKIIGDDEISNEEASGVRSKINDKTTISCLRCDYQSDKLHNFRKHYRSMHLPCKSTKSLFCCDTSFSTKWDYVQHSMIYHGKPKTHNGMKRSRPTIAPLASEPLRGQGSDYFCSDCEFTSSSKYNILKHMKICTNKKSNCQEDTNKLDDNPNLPDSTTSPGSNLSSNNPILHQMLQAPPLFQEGHALIESFMNCNMPVSSLEVSSSSISDSRKTGLVSSCATLNSANGHREPLNSCSDVYKWPFVAGPSPYSMPCHYPQPYSALYQQQLFSAQSQAWINAHNQYPFIQNSNSAQAIKSFQGQSNATPSAPNNFHVESSSNSTFRVKDSDNEDDIDVVS